jgi:hypothetical protein
MQCDVRCAKIRCHEMTSIHLQVGESRSVLPLVRLYGHKQVPQSCRLSFGYNTAKYGMVEYGVHGELRGGEGSPERKVREVWWSEKSIYLHMYLFVCQSVCVFI